MKELPYTKAIGNADRCTLKARNQLRGKSTTEVTSKRIYETNIPPDSRSSALVFQKFPSLKELGCCLLRMKEKHLVAFYLSDRPELFYPACIVCELFKGLQKYLRTGGKT